MKIFTLNMDNQTNFSSYRRISQQADGHQVYNTTRMFRRDINFDSLGDFLLSKYGNKQKWNVYSFACSDCSEAYSFIIEMKEKTGNLKSFSPIFASDIDFIPLQDAFIKQIVLQPDDIERINSRTSKFSDYFSPLSIIPTQNEFSLKNPTYRVLPALSENIRIKQANLFDEIKNIKSDNSFVMIRNVWRFLSDKERLQLATELFKKMGKNSYLMLGRGDEINWENYPLYAHRKSETYKALEKTGFELIDKRLRIFKKRFD